MANLKNGNAGIDGLLQVILNVHDMNRQVAFYRDVLGLVMLYPGGVGEDFDFSNEYFVRFDTGSGWIALHAGRKQPNNGEEPRISFAARDLDAARGYLLGNGVSVGEIRSPAPGVQVLDARDPEGNVFHLETHDH